MIARKNKIVSILTQGIASLFRKHKIDWLQGYGRLLKDKQVEIKSVTEDESDTQVIVGKHIIIATGSVPATIPVAEVDNERIFDSTGALEFNQAPRTLGIIASLAS